MTGDEETVAGAEDDVHEFEVRGKGCIIDSELTRMDCGCFPVRGQ